MRSTICIPPPIPPSAWPKTVQQVLYCCSASLELLYLHAFFAKHFLRNIDVLRRNIARLTNMECYMSEIAESSTD